MTEQPKTERVTFSVTIDKNLAEYIEREVRHSSARSKSAIVERVIREAIRADIEGRNKASRRLERAIKRYGGYEEED